MSIDFPKEEERILARWKEIDAFLTQVELVRILSLCLYPAEKAEAAFGHCSAEIPYTNERV
jgi:hypothetical protein